MTTFLVTGGAGFIGSHLCDRLLAEGHRVVAVDDLSTGRIANLGEARGYGNEFTFFNMDVRADGSCRCSSVTSPEVVMHVAAQAAVSRSMEDPVFDASVNVMGSLNVLECSRWTGVRKVVYAASGGTLYGEPRKLPVKETARTGSRPVSPYGISKKVVIDYLVVLRALPRARLHRARARQRLRPPPGPRTARPASSRSSPRRCSRERRRR